jgi:hypothetical protein
MVRPFRTFNHAHPTQKKRRRLDVDQAAYRSFVLISDRTITNVHGHNQPPALIGKGRAAILLVHLKKIHLAPVVSVEAIAALTPEFFGDRSRQSGE